MTTRSRGMNAMFWKISAVSLLLHSIAATTCGLDVTVEALRCEYLINPLGIDAARPHLGWILASHERGQKQTAYQILVASSGSNLALIEATCGTAERRHRARASRLPMPASRWNRECDVFGKCGFGTRTESPALGANRQRGRWGCSKTPTGRRSGSAWTRPPETRSFPASERPLFWTGRRPTRECM